MHANIAALKPLGDLPVTFDIPTPPLDTKEPAMPDPIEDLLRQAENHDQPRIVRKAEKVRSLIDDLETAIEADKADAEKRAKIAKLEAELAALRGTKPRKAERSDRLTRGEHPCRVDGCDAVKDTAQGRAAHERMAHDFNIKAAS
jgi:hypothetical protein